MLNPHRSQKGFPVSFLLGGMVTGLIIISPYLLCTMGFFHKSRFIPKKQISFLSTVHNKSCKLPHNVFIWIADAQSCTVSVIFSVIKRSKVASDYHQNNETSGIGDATEDSNRLGCFWNQLSAK